VEARKLYDATWASVRISLCGLDRPSPEVGKSYRRWVCVPVPVLHLLVWCWLVLAWGARAFGVAWMPPGTFPSLSTFSPLNLSSVPADFFVGTWSKPHSTENAKRSSQALGINASRHPRNMGWTMFRHSAPGASFEHPSNLCNFSLLARPGGLVCPVSVHFSPCTFPCAIPVPARSPDPTPSADEDVLVGTATALLPMVTQRCTTHDVTPSLPCTSPARSVPPYPVPDIASVWSTKHRRSNRTSEPILARLSAASSHARMLT
jgi:hypothetical protein